jgi:hypothetical protein
MTDRNPTILPEPNQPKVPRCPRCKGTSYTARNDHGVVEKTCKGCGQKWQGGLPQTPADPRQPLPPEPPKPGTITYTADRTRTGDITEIHENRQRVDLTTDFRKGAPIEDEGEEI